MLKTVDRTVSENKLLDTGDSVLACISGGADSIALLHALIFLRVKYKLRIGIAHMNHSLRGADSDEECRFTESLAKGSKIPFYFEKADVTAFMKSNRLSLEDAARQVRYAFFHDTAARHGFHKIATGHHADDNAELVLMNLLRGSGPQGLSGMSPISGNKLIRPLLDVTRADIEGFLKVRQLDFRTDTSNFDRTFTRNRIRLDLIPSLAREYNPNISKSLNRTAAIIRSDEEWIEGVVNSLYIGLLISKEKNTMTFSVKKFTAIHPAARRRVIRRAIQELKGDLKKITRAHTDAAAAMAESESSLSSIDLPDRIRVIKSGENFLIRRELQSLRSLGKGLAQDVHSPFNYQIERPGNTVITLLIEETGAKLRFSEVSGGTETSQSPVTALLNLDTLCFPLTVRNMMPGDRFTPQGMTGSQKVKKFFINNKVPREQRAASPLVVSENRIALIAGHRIDNGFKTDSSTEKILKVELLLA